MTNTLLLNEYRALRKEGYQPPAAHRVAWWITQQPRPSAASTHRSIINPEITMTDKVTKLPRTTKKTVVAQPAKPEVHAAFSAYCETLGIQPQNVGEAKWQIWSVVASVAVLALGVVVGCIVANTLAFILVNLGVWSFLATIVALMGYMLSGVAAMWLSGRVAQYVVQGTIADDIERAATKLLGKVTYASTWLKQRSAA